MRTSHKAKDAAAGKQSYACDAFTGHDKAHQPGAERPDLADLRPVTNAWPGAV